MWSIFSRDPTSSFPYEILEAIEVDEERCIWKLHRGRKKQGGGEVTLFLCEAASSSAAQLDLAKAAIKRLKTLRHPSVLTFLDSLENDKLAYLVTEPVTPLLTWFKESNLSAPHKSFAASWGLLQVTKGLSFLNNEGNLTHFNICASSIFVTRGGEWKIGGLEVTSSESAVFPTKVLPSFDVYHPPEKADPSKMRTTTKWSADMWGLGCLIWEVFNGPLQNSIKLQETSKLPKSLIGTYCSLVGAAPGSRPNPKDVVAKLSKPGQYFKNDLVETLIFLEEIQIKDSSEKHKFFSELTPKLDNIPDYVAKNKILPALLNAHDFSNVGSVVLSPMFKIGKLLDETEYQKHILPCVVKLFSSSDRATRLKLLQQIEHFAEHMSPQVINDQVFPPLSTGFLDNNPTIREHTVKAVLFLAPKLNYNNLNVEVMKHFARVQSKDDQGGIRTNTTVCLGKIAPYLHPETRQKCLISAFTRAMRDPFPPSRSAGVMAIAASQQYFPLSDVAMKVFPILSHLTLDPEKIVRDNVFKVMKGFLAKLEKVSEDPTLREEMEAEVASAAAVSSAPGSTAASWAGWAVGTLSSKFYKTNISQGAQNDAQEDQEQVKDKEKPAEKSAAPKSSSMSTSSSQNHITSTVTTPVEDIQEDGWEDSEWKSMDSPGPARKTSTKIKSPTVAEMMSDMGEDNMSAGGDAWEDAEEWGSLEDAPGEGLSEFESFSDGPKVKTTALIDWESSPNNAGDDFLNSFASPKDNTSMGAMLRTSTSSIGSGIGNTGGWADDWGGNSVSSNASTAGSDDAKLLREQKRLQRQKEIEAKRAARAGPMKLGAKKI